jgi:hypothetical protein
MMQELQDFATILMNHVRNSDRTSLDDVLTAFDTWKNKHQENQQAILDRQEAYRSQHENPRNEKNLAYAQYLQDKRADFPRMDAKAPSSQKMQEMKQWLARHGLPESLKQGLQTDLIYTSK